MPKYEFKEAGNHKKYKGNAYERSVWVEWKGWGDAAQRGEDGIVSSVGGMPQAEWLVVGYITPK